MTGSAARTNARKCLLQAIYAWDITHPTVDELLQQFAGDGAPQVLALVSAHTQAKRDEEKASQSKKPTPVDTDYINHCLPEIITHIEASDALIARFTARSIDKLDGVERALLRIAVFELSHRLEVPYRVVINEALELCKCFGSVDGHKFINGVLDKVADALGRKQHDEPV